MSLTAEPLLDQKQSANLEQQCRRMRKRRENDDIEKTRLGREAANRLISATCSRTKESLVRRDVLYAMRVVGLLDVTLPCRTELSAAW